MLLSFITGHIAIQGKFNRIDLGLNGRISHISAPHIVNIFHILFLYEAFFTNTHTYSSASITLQIINVCYERSISKNYKGSRQ